MARLKSALLSKYSSQRDRVKVYNPRNCDELRLYFKGEKIAKVIIFPILLIVGGGILSKQPAARGRDTEWGIGSERLQYVLGLCRGFTGVRRLRNECCHATADNCIPQWSASAEVAS
jgi:hypothetical protein